MWDSDSLALLPLFDVLGYVKCRAHFRLVEVRAELRITSFGRRRGHRLLCQCLKKEAFNGKDDVVCGAYAFEGRPVEWKSQVSRHLAIAVDVVKVDLLSY